MRVVPVKGHLMTYDPNIWVRMHSGEFRCFFLQASQLNV